MKKIIFALILTLALPASALAAPVGWKDAASCVIPPDHGVWNQDNTKLLGCITDEAWQAAEQAAAARSGMHLPVIAPGATFTDETGIQYDCPYFYVLGCYDLTRTSAYRASMQSAARELIAEGFTAQSLPRFAGWIKSVQ